MEKEQKEQKELKLADGIPGVGSNNQRIPNLMINVRKGNTDVRDGKCYILYRSELDPRWGRPQFIDETVIDRNRLESMNLQHLNPDIAVRTHVKCICTRLINLREDWYAQAHDGTVLCNACTRCFRCFTICFTAGRKLNSVDGFVLCNRCMLSYGRYRKPKFFVKVQPMPRTLDDMEAAMAKQQQKQPQPQNNEPEGGNNSDNMMLSGYSYSCSSSDNYESSYNSNGNNTGGGRPNNQELSEPRFRDEGRRPLRLILYPNPRPENYGRPDYRFESPPYLAVDRNAEGQACPECNKQALAQALVVPGIARVYHEKSFRCAGCKRPLYMGYQLPQVQFQACSCVQQVTIWCTGPACELARIAHHADKNCQLEPLHPGGRPKRDVPGFLPRFDPAAYRDAAGGKGRKQK